MENEKENKDWLDVEGLKDYLFATYNLDIHISTIYRYTANKSIPFTSVLGRKMFQKSDIDSWIVSNKQSVSVDK